MTDRPDVSRVWASNAPPTNIQSPDEFETGKIARGWEAEIPPFQWFNWVQNKNDLFKLALVERGVPAWGPDVSYQEGALAYLDDNGLIYRAQKANRNVKPELGDSVTWVRSAVQITQGNLDDLESRIETHIATTSNPHRTTAEQVGTYTKAVIDSKVKASDADLAAHEKDTDNPHKVTASQAGGVPQSGGVFTGQISSNADRFELLKDRTDLTVGIITEDSGMALMRQGARLGIDKANKPYFEDVQGVKNELLHDTNYKELRLAYENEFTAPKPDFYMPLTNDTNIYEGVGVTEFTRASGATYVDKLGTLRRAGVDEPRFEAEGYLAEGASTNLFPKSDNPDEWGYNAAVVEVTTKSGWDGLKYADVLLKTVGSNEGTLCTYSAYSKPKAAGDVVSGSIWVTTGPDKRIRLRFSDDSGAFLGDCSIFTKTGTTSQPTAKVIRRAGTWIEVSYSFTVPASSAGRKVRLDVRGLSLSGPDVRVAVAFPQFEDFPISSSYIPTNGAVATRMPDFLQLPDAIGMGFYRYNPFTLAVDLSWSGKPNDYPRAISIGGDSARVGASNDRPFVAAYGGGAPGLGFTVREPKVRLVFGAEGSKQVILSGGQYLSGTRTPDREITGASFIGGSSASSDSRHFWGHIKGFRVWHKLLTQEQMSSL